MSDRAARLIASGFVVGAGGITFSLGMVARAVNHVNGDGGQAAGTFLIVGGIIAFLMDWIMSWRDELRKRPPGAGD